jgi:hypothetical protein
MVKGTIRIGKQTANHGAWLTAHGYTVDAASKPGFIVVEGTEFVEALNLQENAVDALKAVIEKKQLLTYSTKATIEGGKTRSSIMLCTHLGPVSALIVKPEGAAKAAKASAFAAL